MSKGSVYIVNTQKLDIIYTRVNVSRAGIQMISYLQKSKQFITISDELDLSVKFRVMSNDINRFCP